MIKFITFVVIAVLFAALILICVTRCLCAKRQREQEAIILKELQPWIDNLQSFTFEQLNTEFKAFRDELVEKTPAKGQRFSEEEIAAREVENLKTLVKFRILYQNIRRRDSSSKLNNLSHSRCGHSMFHPLSWFKSRPAFPDPDFE